MFFLSKIFLWVCYVVECIGDIVGGIGGVCLLGCDW